MKSVAIQLKQKKNNSKHLGHNVFPFDVGNLLPLLLQPFSSSTQNTEAVHN